MFLAIEHKLRKNRKAQGTVEFGLSATLIVFMLVGTIDVFNLAVTYMQMTFFGTELLNSALQGFGNDKNVGSYIRRHIESGQADDGFPMEFFFHNKTGTTFKVDPKYPSARRNVNQTGGLWCYDVSRDVDLLILPAIVGKDKITMTKKVCAIQEEPGLSSGSFQNQRQRSGG